MKRYKGIFCKHVKLFSTHVFHWLRIRKYMDIHYRWASCSLIGEPKKFVSWSQFYRYDLGSVMWCLFILCDYWCLFICNLYIFTCMHLYVIWHLRSYTTTAKYRFICMISSVTISLHYCHCFKYKNWCSKNAL